MTKASNSFDSFCQWCRTSHLTSPDLPSSIYYSCMESQVLLAGLTFIIAIQQCLSLYDNVLKQTTFFLWWEACSRWNDECTQYNLLFVSFQRIFHQKVGFTLNCRVIPSVANLVFGAVAFVCRSRKSLWLNPLSPSHSSSFVHPYFCPPGFRSGH